RLVSLQTPTTSAIRALRVAASCKQSRSLGSHNPNQRSRPHGRLLPCKLNRRLLIFTASLRAHALAGSFRLQRKGDLRVVRWLPAAAQSSIPDPLNQRWKTSRDCHIMHVVGRPLLAVPCQNPTARPFMGL